MNPRQQEACNLAVITRRSCFITGGGGVGKSHLLKRIRSGLQLRKLKVATTATTGLAANNVEGETIHSLLGLSLGQTATSFCDKCKVDRTEQIKSLAVLIVDEVSMASGEFLDRCSEKLAALRGMGDFP